MQKISAIYYMKNNKRRVSVLVVSLAMFFVVEYLVMFLLSTTSATFRSVLTDVTKSIQYITLNSRDMDIDFDSNPEEDSAKIYLDAVRKKFAELEEGIRQCEGVEDTFVAQVEYSYIGSIVGNFYVEVPMVDKAQMEKILRHVGAELVEGRLPNKANEVVLDTKMFRNYGYRIGDALSQNEHVVVVGRVDCDYYFGCGLCDEKNTMLNPMICVISDRTIKDLKGALENQGILLEHSQFVDAAEGEKDLNANIIDVIESSTNMLFVGTLVIVAILVIIVNISYMRDRRSEWCLYSSIGYGRKAIYFSIFREQLFTFLIAFCVAVAVSGLLMKIIDVTVIQAMGLMCTWFMPDILIKILCAYVILFGIMQIPLRVEIYKIKTIDAIDDDI